MSDTSATSRQQAEQAAARRADRAFEVTWVTIAGMPRKALPTSDHRTSPFV